LVFVKAAAAQQWENWTDLVRLKTDTSERQPRRPDAATSTVIQPELCATSVCCSMMNFLWSIISLRSPPPASISYGGSRQLRCLLGPEVTAQLVRRRLL